MTIGFLGLGKMGSRLAFKAAIAGHDVLVWNRTPDDVAALILRKSTIKGYGTVGELIAALIPPRVIWLMLPAGEATESVLGEAIKHLSKGDIVIDGGNADFNDTERRAKELAGKGIRFLGIGVSGGIVAEKSGFPLMAGGDQSAYEEIKPILDSLSSPSGGPASTRADASSTRGGHFYFGPGGAGHFVKMIHNGIEYGYMQSLAEGLAVLEKSPYRLDLESIVKLWQKGTLVSGFMLDRALEVLSADPKLGGFYGAVAETGEARWTVEQAQKEGVEVPVIAASLAYRQKSQVDLQVQKSFTARFLSALRSVFGGHPK